VLNEAIKKRREELKLSQESLADRIDGVKNRQSIQKWEADTVPRAKLWPEIERALEVPTGWIASNLVHTPFNHSHNTTQPSHSNPPTNIRGQMNSTERFFWKMYKRHGSEDFLEDCIKVLIERKEEAEFLKKSEGKNISNG